MKYTSFSTILAVYPKMIIMRNTCGGCIWQAYRVENEQEETILTKNARHNGFIVQSEPPDYTDETTPGWRNCEEWQFQIEGRLTPRAQKRADVRAVLKDIPRVGPYWLGGYDDWLVSCFSLRSLEDLFGFTPIACYSEHSNGCCHQWMVCTKDGEFYVDHLDCGHRSGYGLQPVKAEDQTYPPHIYDWVFKKIIPNSLSLQPNQTVNNC